MATRKKPAVKTIGRTKTQGKASSNKVGLWLILGFVLLCGLWVGWKKADIKPRLAPDKGQMVVNQEVDHRSEATSSQQSNSLADESEHKFEWPIPGDWPDEAQSYLTPSVPEGAEIVKHTAYQLAYYEAAEQPYWVSYVADRSLVAGGAERRNNFFEDVKVSTGSATTRDYSRSGWSRGHMAPCDDFKANQEICDETFAMSNMCPQNQSLNGGRWNSLETFVNRRAFRGKSSIVICGPIFRTSPANIGKIGRSEVWVPDAFYKVVYSGDKGEDRVIAFVMDNKPQPKGPLSQWAVSIDEIEKATDLDFFASMPDEKEERLESQVVLTGWSLP